VYCVLYYIVSCIESLSDDDAHIFLLILYQLVPQLSISTSRSSVADTAASNIDVDDSDSDDAMMDVDGQVHYFSYFDIKNVFGFIRRESKKETLYSCPYLC